MSSKRRVNIPSGVTDVEQRSVKESAEHANASEIHLISEPMAAAIGIGIDVSKPIGNMIVDIGGGTTEIAVISLNGISAIETIKVAGDEQTDAIVEWFKNQHKLGIGERTAENIKSSVGSAIRTSGENISVKGRDLVTGLPKTIEISTDEIRQALAETVFQITTAIKKALDKTPPEHAADIIDYGIILTGGNDLSALDNNALSQQRDKHENKCIKYAIENWNEIIYENISMNSIFTDFYKKLKKLFNKWY